MKSLSRFCATLGAITILTASLSPPLYGNTIESKEDPTKFGKLDQGRTTCSAMGCAPTAAVNSFVYLQNMFPGTYPTPLVPHPPGMQPTVEQLKTVANNLSGATFMKSSNETGTTIENFILGKRAYIESIDKGVTTYAAQVTLPWSGTAKPGFVQDNTPPTLAFLAKELKAGEDVEVGIATVRLGHFLTLTGITFDDTTNKGEFTFVDPNGGVEGKAMITGLRNGVIRTDYLLGGVRADIVNAVAESPVPEPSSLVLFATGVLGLLGYVWHGQRKNKTRLLSKAVQNRG